MNPNSSYMFYNFDGLTSVDLSTWNASEVTSMAYMFYDDTNLKKVNLTNTDVANLVTTDHMFQYCSSLT